MVSARFSSRRGSISTRILSPLEGGHAAAEGRAPTTTSTGRRTPQLRDSETGGRPASGYCEADVARGSQTPRQPSLEPQGARPSTAGPGCRARRGGAARGRPRRRSCSRARLQRADGFGLETASLDECCCLKSQPRLDASPARSTSSWRRVHHVAGAAAGGAPSTGPRAARARGGEPPRRPPLLRPPPEVGERGSDLLLTRGPRPRPCMRAPIGSSSPHRPTARTAEARLASVCSSASSRAPSRPRNRPGCRGALPCPIRRQTLLDDPGPPPASAAAARS